MFVSQKESSEAELLSKYGDDILSVYKKRHNDLQSHFDCEEGNSIAYRVDVNFVRINNKSKADYSLT